MEETGCPSTLTPEQGGTIHVPNFQSQHFPAPLSQPGPERGPPPSTPLTGPASSFSGSWTTPCSQGQTRDYEPETREVPWGLTWAAGGFLGRSLVKAASRDAVSLREGSVPLSEDVSEKDDAWRIPGSQRVAGIS